MRLIRETITDIGYFMILFIFILLTFGNVLLILGEGRTDQIYSDYFGINFLNVIMN